METPQLIGGFKEKFQKFVYLYKELKNENEIWHTVYHKESDFSEPERIKRGCGLVNRMGFIIASEDFIPEDEIFLKGKEYKQLKDDIREAEMKS